MPNQSREKFFWRNEPWIGRSGDDEDDDPCLSKALLQVSDEFDSLSCSCDADSFILVASAPCATASSSARRPNPHLLQLAAIACTSPTIIAQ